MAGFSAAAARAHPALLPLPKPATTRATFSRSPVYRRRSGATPAGPDAWRSAPAWVASAGWMVATRRDSARAVLARADVTPRAAARGVRGPATVARCALHGAAGDPRDPVCARLGTLPP